MKRSFNIFWAFLALILALTLTLMTGCDKIFPQNGDQFSTEPYPAPDYASLELSEYIKLGEYKGMTVNTIYFSVTDDIVLWNTVVDNAEVIKYPEDALFYYEDQTARRYLHYAEEGGMTYDELLASLDMTQDDVDDEAKRLVKKDLVELAIIKAEKIELTEKEKETHFEKYVSLYINSYGYSEEYVRAELTDEIYGTMLHDKMMEYLMINNTLVSTEE